MIRFENASLDYGPGLPALAVTNPAAAAATPPPASPTTRGWTMLEELNDAAPAGAASVPRLGSPPDRSS
jgi:hypothetical protein